LSINIKRTKVINRLKRLHQKLPYDLYEYNPTGIKLRRKEIADTKNQRITNERTRFLNLIIPIPVKSERTENIIANKT